MRGGNTPSARWQPLAHRRRREQRHPRVGTLKGWKNQRMSHPKRVRGKVPSPSLHGARACGNAWGRVTAACCAACFSACFSACCGARCGACRAACFSARCGAHFSALGQLLRARAELPCAGGERRRSVGFRCASNPCGRPAHRRLVAPHEHIDGILEHAKLRANLAPACRWSFAQRRRVHPHMVAHQATLSISLQRGARDAHHLCGVRQRQ